MIGRSRFCSQEGSIPLVLLASIILAGLIVALFIDVITGVRLARDDRDFNQAIQIADAGMQEAFTVLARLDEGDMPPVGQDYLGGPQTGALSTGEYNWTARRVANNRWQVRSEGEFGEKLRVMEASMGPETLFALAAFADLKIELRGGNDADSYNAATANGGRGSVGSNKEIILRGSAAVDWVMRYDNATYNSGGIIRGGIETGEYQQLPDIGSSAYNEIDGACATGAEHDDITSVLPLVQGETYCVAKARFPEGQHTIISSGDADQDALPTKIYIAPSGNLELLGSGNTRCDKVSCVNWDVGDTKPDATRLEIYLAGGGGVVKANNHTVIAAGIYAPLSNCSGPNAQGDIYGSIVCRTLDSKGGWNFHYDERFEDAEAEYFAIQGIREETTTSTSFSGS
jgi:hypothetical protein